MAVQVYSDFASVPDRVKVFAESTSGRAFYRRLDYYSIILKTATALGDVPRIYVAELQARPVALLIGRERCGAGRLRTHMLLGAGQAMYAASYGPILDPTLGIPGLREIASAIGDNSPPFEVLRFDGLDPHSSEFLALRRVLRERGMLVQQFFNFEAWIDDVTDISFADYLTRRPADIRTVAEAVWSLPDNMRLELATQNLGIAALLIDYALVDVLSANPPELYPEFVSEIVRMAASLGALRFGLIYVEDQPAAAEIWTVLGGHAMNWRRRQSARYARSPAATMLTLAMLRHLLQKEGVTELEFSRESSGSAPDWLTTCRPRVGLIATNPFTPKGLLASVRHVGGHGAMSLVNRISGRSSSVR